MQITLSEFIVLLDCAMGRLRIADNGNLWRFDAEVVQKLLNTLLSRADAVNMSISVTPTDEAPRADDDARQG